MAVKPAGVPLLLIAFSAACSAPPFAATLTPEIASHPPDFAVEYRWQEGSLPPPHHYEYTIRLGPGAAGEIVFVPDYAFADPPVWTETFEVADRDLTDLYRLMVRNEVFSRAWQTLDPPPVGGSVEALDVTAGGRQVSIPGLLIDQQAQPLAEVYQAVRALLPPAVWDGLLARQAKYKANYPDDA